MARNAKHHSIQRLVGVKTGLISREIFVDEVIYHQEQERVFARTWLFVGHESQVPTPGDYFVSCMGEESVILTRDHRQQIYVFLNTCRHRSMKVCRYDEGNTPVYLPLSWLELRHRWAAGGGALLQGGLPGAVGQIAVGAA